MRVIGRLKSYAKRVLPVGMSVRILDGLAGELPVQKGVSTPIRRMNAKRNFGDDSAFAGNALTPRRAAFAEHFDSWQATTEALDYATSSLAAAGIQYALLPTRYGAKTIILREPDRVRAILALTNLTPANTAWHLAPVKRKHPDAKHAIDLTDLDEASIMKTKRLQSPEFVLFDHQVSASGDVFGDTHSGVRISFWRPLADGTQPRADGYTYEAGTLMAPRQNGVASYLTPQAWERAIRSPKKWPEDVGFPHIYQIAEPIDVVYTWVDGDEPAWQQRKDAAMGKTDASALNETAANASRYASRNELMYSLRSIEMYANWVRNIYIVTDDQVPTWLDTTNPRIKVVHHSEIFTDPSVLPVFNSHAIESQLHHIEGLSNQFLYMNDDVLFGKRVQAADFFHSKRISKYFPSKATLDIDPPSARDLPVLSAAKNARALIAKEFGVTITNKFKHTPMPLQRDVLYEMEERFPELFRDVAGSQFRHPKDYSIASGLYHYYAFATGRAVPGSISYGYQDISRPDLPIFLHRLTRNHPYRVFCINDTASSPEQLASLHTTLVETMERCYPFTSNFEKPAAE